MPRPFRPIPPTRHLGGASREALHGEPQMCVLARHRHVELVDDGHDGALGGNLFFEHRLVARLDLPEKVLQRGQLGDVGRRAVDARENRLELAANVFVANAHLPDCGMGRGGREGRAADILIYCANESEQKHETKVKLWADHDRAKRCRLPMMKNEW